MSEMEKALSEILDKHYSLVEENKRMREALMVARVYVEEREKDDGYFHQEEAGYDLAMIDRALGDTNA